MDEKQWLAERRLGIGGSDWYELIYERGCPRRLLLDKRGVEPDVATPAETQAIFDRGHALEPLILGIFLKDHEEFEEIKNIRLRELPEPWWVGNPDFVLRDKRDGSLCVLDAKTAGQYNYKRHEKDPPPYWEYQAHQYMRLVGAHRAYFCCLHPDSWAHFSAEYERKDDMISEMIEIGNQFWHTVCDKTADIEPLDVDAQQCSRCAYRLQCEVRRVKGPERSRSTASMAELDRLLDLRDQLSRQKSEINDELSEITAKITTLLDGKGTIETGSWIAGVTKYETTRVDTSALKSTHPEIYQKFATKSASYKINAKRR